jgi:hypothetical protein
MKPIVLDLTPEQLLELAPLLQRIGELSDAGTPGMLLAQIAAGQMRCGVLSHAHAVGVQEVMGSTSRKTMRTFADTPRSLFDA